jgi:hypothetical protein
MNIKVISDFVELKVGHKWFMYNVWFTIPGNIRDNMFFCLDGPVRRANDSVLQLNGMRLRKNFLKEIKKHDRLNVTDSILKELEGSK